MKLSNVVYAAVGYTLGARAGRERYETIVRLGRRVAGSQTVQSTAGVVQARLDRRVQHARHAVGARLSGGAGGGAEHSTAQQNGHRR
ncbi:MAG: hypothetical protein ACR2LX_06545 [Jatrophihabitans sp.]